VGASARPICETLRTLAHGDSSVALVCAMHPAVLNFWMATSQAPAPFDKAWDEQRRSIFRNVCAGAWWGTIASDPALRATSRGQGPRRGEARPMAPTCSPDRKTLAAGRGLPPT